MNIPPPPGPRPDRWPTHRAKAIAARKTKHSKPPITKETPR